MGIIKHGILGGVRNKVGPVVGRSHRGQDILTGLPRISNKEKTSGQLAQCDRFGMLSSFLADIKLLLRIGFKKFTKSRSALNSAFSYNYDHAFIEEENVVKLNYPKMVYSRGPVDVVNCPSVSMAGTTVTFSWLPQAENQFNRHSDKASFLIYSEGLAVAICLRNKAQRADLNSSIELDEHLIGKSLHCYMSFESADGKLVGDSRYVGIL